MYVPVALCVCCVWGTLKRKKGLGRFPALHAAASRPWTRDETTMALPFLRGENGINSTWGYYGKYMRN